MLKTLPLCSLEKDIETNSPFTIYDTKILTQNRKQWITLNLDDNKFYVIFSFCKQSESRITNCDGYHICSDTLRAA